VVEIQCVSHTDDLDAGIEVIRGVDALLTVRGSAKRFFRSREGCLFPLC